MAKNVLVADRPVLSLRPQAVLKQRLEHAAGESGRSMAREAEIRLEASFAHTSDLRTVIREEIRAVLAERGGALVLDSQMMWVNPDGHVTLEFWQYRY